MKNFMKTILSGVQTWTRGEIRKSTADWNQNDPNADNYVKNRTHWEEEKSLTLVNNLTSEDENYPRCDFIPGQLYTIIWNGVEYKDQLCIRIGDYDVLGDPEDDFPFYIDDDGENGLWIDTEDDNWTLTITTIETLVHKIPKKFLDLPDDLATQEDIDEVWDYADNAYDVASGKMDKNNPTGTGSFSMNRKANTTIGNCSHAEGKDTTASGQASHAEGYYTKATNNFTHAEGVNTTASGIYSHAEGSNSSATGSISHSEGLYVIAGSSNQHAQGKYNLPSSNDTLAHIVGNGTSSTERSNAHTLDWEGNAWYSGDVYVGSTSGTNKDEGSKKLATEEFVNTALKSAAVVQSDWEQNDSTADDYIKNRPFYTQNGRVALVDNLTRENYENGIHPTCNFVPGQSYDVVCDDILYENIICIEDDGWNVILGDTFYIDDDGGNGLYIEGFEEDWSTLSIFTTQETVKKIDEKYLPNVRKVLKLYTCYSENADDGRAGGTPALAPDKILRAGFADWEDYVTVEPLANADDIVIFEGQTKVGVPANITFCTSFDDYNTSTEYAIITFYSEHEGKIRTMWSRESNLDEYLATQDYVDAEISKISAISLTENLTDPEKQQVRDNIGAGTSNFSGSYNDLTDKPDLDQQELITPEDIDVICGQSIELASEVLL